jgi:PAS domain S-box-containing protein
MTNTDCPAPQTPGSLSKRMLQVIHATPVGVCITNAQGLFEFVNPAYCRFYGYQAEELLGRHFTLVVPPENQALMQQLHDRFIAGSNEVRGEWTVMDRQGNPRQIMADATRIFGDDGQPRKVTFIMDITERIRHERLREDVERLMRHDLRTPLNAVLNIPELLRDDANLTAEQHELLDILEQAARTMVEMIDASLNLYKLEAGTYPLSGQSLDLIELLTRIVETNLKIGVQCENSVQLLIDTRPVTQDDGCPLHGEPLLYYNLFANLLKNALEASPAGAPVKISIQPHEDDIGIEIHNQGCIPEEIRSRFFDKYVTQGKTGGNGLGTYSAKLIVDAVGGTIGFHTDATAGTTLWVSLPRDSRVSSVSSPSPPPSHD